MTRVLFVTCGFPPEQVGGVEQHTLEVARVLRRDGHEVIFYARGTRDDVDEFATYETEFDGFATTRVVFRWSRTRSFRELYDDPALGRAFAAFLERSKPDVVHVHHFAGIGASCLEAIRAQGVPCVMTLHDYYLMCPRGQMFHPELRSCDQAEPVQCGPCIASTWPHLTSADQDDVTVVAELHDWLRGVLAKPDLLVTPSAACRERFVGFGVAPDHVRVALQGQDHAPFVGVQRSPSDRLRVGFVGTLIPSKGTHLIVEAFDRLPAGSASLLLAGNCPPFYQVTDYGDRIRELVASVLAENPVELLGTYAHSDLPALLGRIDVLVVPPLWHEVFGLTLREGMLAGCAVVASQVGGLTDGIEEGVNGFTFPAGDVDALAGILQRFVDEPGLAARLGGAPSNVRRVEDLARELCGVYAEVGAVM